jgi:hypothetical protein
VERSLRTALLRRARSTGRRTEDRLLLPSVVTILVVGWMSSLGDRLVLELIKPTT